jgi:hypothetical protein
MSALNKKDYVNILNYYNMKIPKSQTLLKKHAEKIMADKLCKCIKKLEPKKKTRSIGICTKSIFNLKGYSRGKFQCKNPRTLKFSRRTNSKTQKRH